MTNTYNNVYIYDTCTITGPYESKGPLGSYFDKSYKDLYFGEKAWELAEIKMHNSSINMLLDKTKMKSNKIDALISGDLLNQNISSNFTAEKLGIPMIGIYAACSTSTLGLIIASNMIESGSAKNIICSVSSHNCTSEKQFRQPVEYGGPKPKRATFTVTGAASALVSSKKSKIKITSGTLGTVVDAGIKDAFHMGAVMAPAAAKTIYTHLINTKTKVSDYDLILTGDLGRYGKDILKDYMKEEYNMELNNLDDSACMIYDINKQEVYAGGSGPACIPLVTYGYILDKMKKGKLKKVLMVATGSLHSQASVNLKQTIPAVSHAICLEATL